jgi:putative ABC transport system substrate-binding protein
MAKVRGANSVSRRSFCRTLAGVLAAPGIAIAQASTVRRIGVLSPGTQAASSQNFEALKQGPREYGYVKGKNIVFERRFGEAQVERIADAATELVRMKVDVIVTATDPAIVAVKQRTQAIPIVMTNATDPVGTGFVASLARPGGNITGLSGFSPELSGKRLELLREVLPTLSRVAIIWNPDVRGALLDYKETETAARLLRMRLQSVEVQHIDELDRAVSAIKAGGAEAMIVSPLNPILFSNANQLVGLAQRNRVPSMYGAREYTLAGGLMSYGASVTEQWRRAGAYVDKILRGAKPAELAVEQPTKFELVINLKTANALGLTIPQKLLQRRTR